MNTTIPEPFNEQRESSDRVIGWMIAIATALAILMMAHHPTIHTDAMADVIAEMARKAAINRFVHGSLIALIGVLLFAFSEYSRRRCRNTPLLRAALLAYAIGALASIGAGLINGFVSTELALRYADANADALEVLRHLLRLCWRFNQALAQLGEIGRGMAMVLWSIALLRAGNQRWLGGFGLIAGGVPVLAILSGMLPLDLHGALLALAAMSAWNLALAMQLIRNRLAWSLPVDRDGSPSRLAGPVD